MNCFLLIGSRERKREKERGVRAKNEKKGAFVGGLSMEQQRKCD